MGEKVAQFRLPFEARALDSSKRVPDGQCAVASSSGAVAPRPSDAKALQPESLPPSAGPLPKPQAKRRRHTLH